MIKKKKKPQDRSQMDLIWRHWNIPGSSAKMWSDSPDFCLPKSYVGVDLCCWSIWVYMKLSERELVLLSILIQEQDRQLYYGRSLSWYNTTDSAALLQTQISCHQTYLVNEFNTTFSVLFSATLQKKVSFWIAWVTVNSFSLFYSWDNSLN